MSFARFSSKTFSLALLLAVTLVFFTSTLSAQKSKGKKSQKKATSSMQAAARAVASVPNAKGYTYESVPGDPMDVKIYTLANGLRVYMSINRDEPRIQTNIAVNTGSKQDPTDATGLAHYLEHMLFKGTSKIGTMDWEKEKVILKEISDTYEARRNTTDPAERDRLYKKIDDLSVKASGFAIANEYDKMVSSLGAKGTNAYTSLERTVYINDIPSIELEKWMKLESERFSELVLRLFHTELETVYEEFNRGQDSDRRKAYAKMMEALYKNHTYGTQTTIGTGDDLKNPSMERIHDYFSTYYVPNNMAIILSGDLDPDKTVALVETYFGGMKRKPVPEFKFSPELPIRAVETYEVRGQESEWVTLAWRLAGSSSEDAAVGDLFSSLIYNGQAGLMDIDLLQAQKILGGYAYTNFNKDYGLMSVVGEPREGQTLEEVKDLLLEQVQRVARGDFDQWLMDAVVKDYKLSQYQSYDYNRVRAGVMTNAFILNTPWKDVVAEIDRIDAVTKEDVMAFAQKYIKMNNYVVVNKRTGEGESHKVDKPEITELTLNREVQSPFMMEFEKMESGRVAPQFLDYKQEIQKSTMPNGLELMMVKNKKDPTFQLNYVFDMGERHDQELALAVSLLEFLGTDKYTAAQLQEEFYKLGVYFGVSSGSERSYVYLGGLEESMEKGVELFEHILANVKPDQKAYDDMVAGILKERKDAKLSKGNILRGGLMSYAKYGPKNPMTDQLSESDLLKMDVKSLVSQIRSLPSFKHFVYYYGSKSADQVTGLLAAHHKVAKELKDYPEKKTYAELDQKGNKVLFAHYDMVQTEMMMISKGDAYSEDLLPTSRLFNEYFGSGLSSIIFQEIRESKALAYSAYARYSNARKPTDSDYVVAYVGTQTDKLGEAIDAMLVLMNEMPEAKDQFEDGREAAMKKIETSRTKSQNIFWSYLRAKEFGRDYDVNEKIYEQLDDIDLADVKTFFNEHVKGQDYTFVVIGNRDQVDMNSLKELGPVTELSLEELFGY